MRNKPRANAPVKIERDVETISVSSAGPGDTAEDAIDVEALDDMVEISPRLWVKKSEVPQNIKSIFVKMFEAVAEDAREDDTLHQDLIRMAKIAASEDVGWLLDEYTPWRKTLEKAKKAREKELNLYERTAENMHVDDEREFSHLVRNASARFRRVSTTMKRLDHYMGKLEDHITGA